MGVSLGSVYVKGIVVHQSSRAMDGNPWLQWGPSRIYYNALNTWFRHSAFQGNSMTLGASCPRSLGLQGELAAALSWRQKDLCLSYLTWYLR